MKNSRHKSKRAKKSRGSRGYRVSRVSRRSRGSKRMTRKKCRSLLSKKIGINMNEYKSGRYSSPSQAIAVSYSQIKKWYPSCKNKLKKSKK